MGQSISALILLGKLSNFLILGLKTKEVLDDRELKRNIRLANYSITDFYLKAIKADRKEKVKIHSINCGAGLKKRLCDLGLYEGMTIEVIKNAISGPIIIKVFDSRIILGRGQAYRIIVEPVGKNEERKE